MNIKFIQLCNTHASTANRCIMLSENIVGRYVKSATHRRYSMVYYACRNFNGITKWV